MCGRITQRSPPDQLGLRITMGTPDDPRAKDVPQRSSNERLLPEPRSLKA